ncbi:hypothetical protein QE152_g8421 [Popillia japonica]|uniref:Uncharacterized protein n=1 Tax=Popillia japonica TaxID=7064 RepID=A0AAW1M3A8_POPJA
MSIPIFSKIKNRFQYLLIIRNVSYLPCTRLKDKVAVVTSSTSGLGFAIAKRLGLEGATVSISSRNSSNVERALKELTDSKISAVGTVCDITKLKDRKELLDTVQNAFGKIDILVPHASKYTACTELECEENNWNEAIEVNLKSAFFLVKETIPIMKKNNSGKIIFITSIASYRYIDMFSGAFSIAKTGLIGLTKSLAWQLAPAGIYVNAIAPGLLDIKSITSSESAKNYIQEIPMKKFGTVDDVAAGVAFLASQDASYITGEIIIIGGGMNARL